MKRIQLHRPFALVLAGLLCASCASQQEFNKARDLAKHYEGEVFNLQHENAVLKQQNSKLTNELAMSTMNALEAGGGSGDLEARLAELDRRLKGLSSNPTGISKLDLGGGNFLYMVPDAVLFDSGSAQVGQDGKRQLTDVAADIRRGGHGQISVRGHTDSVPVAKPATIQKYPHGNLELSAARALEVAVILTGAGIPKDSVVISGFGPSEPLVPNDTAENRKLNRRVEIYVAAPRQ